MDQPHNNPSAKRSERITLAVLSVSIFTVAFFLGAFTGPKVFKVKNPSNMAVENTYEAGWEAAKRRLGESEYAAVVSSQDTRSVRGSIDAINGDRISVRIRPFEPLTDPALDRRVVVANNTTKIIRLDQKDGQEFQKEINAFFAKIQNQKNSPESIVNPPEPFIKTAINISDLKVGDRIVVIASEDIKTAKEFFATEIQMEGGRTISAESSGNSLTQ